MVKILQCTFDSRRTTHKDMADFLDEHSGKNSIVLITSLFTVFFYGFAEYDKYVMPDGRDKNTYSAETYLKVSAGVGHKLVYQGEG